MTEERKDVRSELLRAGREEFLKYGFRAASLRRICAAADVTTGALYFFFKNKEDLFCRIVEDPLSVFQKMYDQLVNKELDDLQTGADNEDQVIRVLLHYRKECLLLFNKAEGTRYEHFREEYTEKLEQTFQLFFDRYAPGKADPKLVGLLAHMRMQGYMELVEKDYSLEEARRLVRDMAVYADAGFRALVIKLNEM